MLLLFFTEGLTGAGRSTSVWFTTQIRLIFGSWDYFLWRSTSSCHDSWLPPERAVKERNRECKEGVTASCDSVSEITLLLFLHILFIRNEFHQNQERKWTNPRCELPGVLCVSEFDTPVVTTSGEGIRLLKLLRVMIVKELWMHFQTTTHTNSVKSPMKLQTSGHRIQLSPLTENRITRRHPPSHCVDLPWLKCAEGKNNKMK